MKGQGSSVACLPCRWRHCHLLLSAICTAVLRQWRRGQGVFCSVAAEATLKLSPSMTSASVSLSAHSLARLQHRLLTTSSDLSLASHLFLCSAARSSGETGLILPSNTVQRMIQLKAYYIVCMFSDTYNYTLGSGAN